MNKILKKIKPMIFIILITFSWISVGGWNYAYAFEVKSTTKQTQKIETAGSLISKEITEIEKITEKAERKTKRLQNIDEEVKVLKNKYGIIKSLDKKAREEFSNTEKFLKSKGISKKILDRHYNFVKQQYEENILKLNQKLEEIEKSDKTNQSLKIAELKQFLKQSVYHPKIKPIDPNKLPHRSIKHPHRKPRLSQATPEDKTQLSLRVPIYRDEAIPKGNVVVHSVELTNVIATTSKKRGGKQSHLVVQLIDKILNVLTPSVEAADLPTSGYLAQTIEVQLTDEIRNLATVTLKSNPVLIYEYVRNNFVYEPYYGSLKGAQETLWEKAGNDYDQASLLIALFRAANIPARYVYGTVEISIDRAMNWVGVEDKRTCGDLFASAGIPAALVIKGGEISSLQIEHCWVEAYVNYSPSEGTGTTGKKLWIPMDPSYKQFTKKEALDLKQITGFHAEQFINEIKTHSNYNEAGSYITTIDEQYIQQKMQELKANLDQYINQNIPGTPTFFDVLGYRTIVKQEYGILASTLPYKVKNIISRYSEIPDNLRYKIRFTISNPAEFEGSSVSYTAITSSIVNKRITVSYMGSSDEDRVILKNYENIEDAPAYLIEMVPLLRIDGNLVLTGGKTILGNSQTLQVEFISPTGLREVIENEIIVGSNYGVIIDMQTVSRESIVQHNNKLKATIDKLNSGTGTILADDVMGELLYDIGQIYFAELNALNRVSGTIINVDYIKEPTLGITGIKMKPNYLFGIPLTTDIKGLFIDVGRNEYIPYSTKGNRTDETAFMVQNGMIMSMLEKSIWKHMVDIDAVSTVSILQIASQQEIPIYQITNANISSILPQLEMSEDIKINIQSAINSGKVVTVPKVDITYNGWNGVGYVILDPTTGAGAYMISGGIGGGNTTPDDSVWQSVKLFSGLYLSIVGNLTKSGTIDIGETFITLLKVASVFFPAIQMALNIIEVQVSNLTPEAKEMITAFVFGLGLMSILIPFLVGGPLSFVVSNLVISVAMRIVMQMVIPFAIMWEETHRAYSVE